MPLNSRELDKRVKKLRKSLKGMRKNPGVEEVHDLRTRTRRVESILHALELDASGNEGRLLRGLKKLRKRAGKVRDMDVFTSYIVGLGLKDDPDCVVRLVHHLGNQRGRQASKLHSAVDKHAPELRRRLKKGRRKLDKAITDFEDSKYTLDGNSSADEAPLHAMSTALRLSKELTGVRRLGRDNLHPYRIEVKRLRYVLEMAVAGGSDQREFIDALNRVQDTIGEWHDWLELSSIARQVLQHGSCALVKKLQQTAERKFGEALQTTEQMRRRYLSAGGAHSRASERRKKRPSGVSGPVLVATSELAA